MATLDEIGEAERNLEACKRSYLERWGWKSTCSTPGSYWLWKRDFADIDAKSKAWHDEHPKASPHVPYGIIAANTDLAVSMTVRCLDDQPESDEEET